MTSEPRLPPLQLDDVDDDQRDVLASLRTDDGVLNIFATLAHHPKLLKRWLVFGAHVMAKNTLDDRQRELVILRTGWRCGSDYEFGQHTIIGRAAGLTDDEIVGVTTDDAGGWTPLEQLLLRATDELLDQHTLTDDTWNALASHLDPQQLLDLIFTVGQYHLVSIALNALGVQREDGVPGFPGETNGTDV